MTRPLRITPAHHIRKALCSLLNSASDMRQAASLMRVGDQEGQRLMRLARAADAAVAALESRYRVHVVPK